MSQASRNLLIAMFVILAIGVGAPLCSSSASAQTAQQKSEGATPKAQPEKTGGWSVNCTNPGQGLACRAVQTILLAKTRQLLISVAVSKPQEGDSAAMLLHLPHGLFNPSGVTFAIDDGKPEALQIQTCDAKGCYAGMPITPEMQAAMLKGTTLKIVFQNLKKQSITVPVPLKGYEEAYKKL